MVKTTTVESFQAAQTEQPARLDIFVNDEDTVQTVAEQIRVRAEDNGVHLPPETIAEQAASMIDARDEKPANGSGTYLREIAERALRDRGEDVPHVGNAFEGMEINVDPSDAIGLVEHQVGEWVRGRGRWATPLEIKHKAEQLLTDAKSARPGPVQAATYTVEAGVVTSFTPDAAPAELPGMPAQPAAVHGDVLTPLKVPSDSIFDDDSEYAMSSPLSQRARALISRHPEHFDHLRRLSVIYLWRKTGGKSKGRVVFGKTSKPSGMLKHFSEADFVVWLAADHCRAAAFDDRQIEALLFHEMLHTAVTAPDENTGRGGGPTLVPHELEVFRAEVEIYGLWAPELKEVGPAFQQVSLFDGQPSDFERQEAAGAAYSDDEADDAPPLDLSGAGVLCWPDGTPMTAEEIAEQEAAEERDDDYDDDGQYTGYISGADEGEEELEDGIGPLARSVDIDPAHLGDGGR